MGSIRHGHRAAPQNPNGKERMQTMKQRKRILSLALAGALAAGCLTGCGGTTEPAPESGASAETAQTSAAPVEAVYPLADGDKTLTVYMKDATSGAVGNWSNIKAFQVAAEKLGVNLEFIHPAVGSEADQFNLMIASGEYPDVILWDFRSSAMSLEQLVDAGVLVDMNDLIRTYAPNYLQVLAENETFRKEATSNNGEYLALYSFSGRAPVSSGPAIRADLLREYGLEVPTTVDDWTNVLTVMKENGHAYPLTTGQNRDGSVWFELLFSTYDTSNSFCLDSATGEVVYGPATENYRSYLRQLNQWYQAGLIDPEFMANDGTAMNAKLTDGRSVAGNLMLSYHIANITNAARQNNPNFEFVGCPWPVLQEGEEPKLIFINGGQYYSGSQAAITTACEDPELATQVLDYFYSEEGNDLLCWGIEGESYTVNEDGTKQYTDAIMHDPNGLSPQEAILQYAIPLYNFSDVILNDSYVQMATTLPEQAAARDTWLDADLSQNMPKLTVAAENQNDFNMIMNDVTTYVQEMYIQFLTGQADLDADWETYVNTLNGMGLETAVGYEREAYELYQAR